MYLYTMEQLGFLRVMLGGGVVISWYEFFQPHVPHDPYVAITGVFDRFGNPIEQNVWHNFLKKGVGG